MQIPKKLGARLSWTQTARRTDAPLRLGLPAASSKERYQLTQPVRISRMSPGSTATRWASRVAVRSASSMMSDSPQRIGSADRLAPPADVGQHAPADDATPGPVLHPVIAALQAPVVAVDQVANVAKPIPLARGLGVQVGDLVVHGHAGAVELVNQGGPPVQGRVGSSISRLRLKLAPRRTAAVPRRAAAPSSRFSVP